MKKSIIFLENYYIVGRIAQSTPDKMSIVAWHNPTALDWDGVFDHKTKSLKNHLRSHKYL